MQYHFLAHVSVYSLSINKTPNRKHQYTRGNGVAIAVSFLLHVAILAAIAFVSVAFGVMMIEYVLFIRKDNIMILGVIAAVTSFILTIVCAYLPCWLAVTFHLTTGQYDTSTAVPEQTVC